MNLEVTDENSKQIFIQAGNINWSTLSLEQQDAKMFEVLILLITTAAPNKSILLDNAYRNVPKKKIQNYLEPAIEGKSGHEVANTLVEYVSFLLGNQMDETYEANLLRCNLESMTSMNADTVDRLCTQLNTIKLGNDNATQTSAVIQEMNDRYTEEELTKILSNEYYFEATSRKILEKLELEKEEKVEASRKRRIAQKEVATEDWVNNFIKPEFRLSFLAILRFNLGQKISKKGETLLETMGIHGEDAAERIIVHEEPPQDRLIFYMSVLFNLTNMTCYPLVGAPPKCSEVLQILRGEINRSKMPSLYNVPPLRLCKEGAPKRKQYDEEQSHHKRMQN